MSARRYPPLVTKWPTGLICAYKVGEAQYATTLKILFLSVITFEFCVSDPVLNVFPLRECLC